MPRGTEASLASIPARPSASVAPLSITFQLPSSDRTSSVIGTPPAGFPREVSSTCVVIMLIVHHHLQQAQASNHSLLFGGRFQLLGGSIMEAAPAEVEHFLGGPARGAHDEDVAEPLLGLALGAGERPQRLPRGPPRAGPLGGGLSLRPRA